MSQSTAKHQVPSMPTNLHMDLAEPVAVDLEAAPWIPSPSPGVERKPLEREGREHGRTTSLVRYLPGSAFSSHTHGGGEEFFVVEGTFCDDTGNFPAGTYVRNPIGSSHAPSSPDGCTIFVKLCQMDPSEESQTVVDTSSSTAPLLALHADSRETVDLLRLDADESVVLEGAEIVLLSGELASDERSYKALTWLRQPAEKSLRLRCVEPATVWRKQGHLPTASLTGRWLPSGTSRMVSFED